MCCQSFALSALELSAPALQRSTFAICGGPQLRVQEGKSSCACIVLLLCCACTDLCVKGYFVFSKYHCAHPSSHVLSTANTQQEMCIFLRAQQGIQTKHNCGFGTKDTSMAWQYIIYFVAEPRELSLIHI